MNWLLQDILVQPEAPSDVAEALKGIVIVDGSRVADMFFNSVQFSSLDMRKDFPCMAPPWDTFFIECRAPKTAYHDELKTHVLWQSGDIALPTRWGTLVQSWELKDAPEHVVSAAVRLAGDEVEKVKWIELFSLFLEMPGQVIPVPVYGWVMVVDESGMIVAHGTSGGKGRVEEDEEGLLPAFGACFLTVCMLHCKNVERRERKTSSLMAKLLTKSPRLKEQLASYHILEVDPNRKLYNYGSREVSLGERVRALHICKGHYKNFTRGAGAFGRVRDILWCPQHKRGSADLGVVMKDYSARSVSLPKMKQMLRTR